MKYLTKSRFNLASECPTKLFYTEKKQYANNSLDNPFLEALAEGGFQVGELAKHYYSNGHNIDTLDYDEALHITNQLLEQKDVTIFEAAVKFENLFIRVDILVKSGSKISLIEVKSKSIDERLGGAFLTANGNGILAKWKPYLYDVAFQRHVVRSAFPDYIVTSYLLLADKNAKAPSDGINQKFKVVEDRNRRKGIKVSSSINQNDISTKLLCTVPVDYYCDLLISNEFNENIFGFENLIDEYSKSYVDDKKIPPTLKKDCRDCEFNASIEELGNGLKSGFEECWNDVLGWNYKDFEKPNVLDIWDCRSKNKFIEEGKIKLSQFSESDFNPKKLRGGNELLRIERQWLQIEKVQNNDNSIWLSREGLKNEMDSWNYPLHFIDFETSTVAIPFNKDRHPYEGIAFQYSHHIVTKDGQVKHQGEYLNVEPGSFPNYDFIRSLKEELSHDNGTIFRYHNHENTFLTMIYEQLQTEDPKIKDKEDLCSFIKSITKSKGDSVESWSGDRNMVDLWVLVKKYYYNPATNGSNSLKDILPSTINSSDYLINKYSMPIYGSTQIQSMNFNNHQWLDVKDGIASDPYSKLSELFENASICENIENVYGIKDGGDAMTAYAKLQFEDLSIKEREKIKKGLLRYCELDTLAMVMIYEAWKNWLN